MIRHIGPISNIAVSNNVVATAGYDNKVILWDGDRRQPLECVSHDHLVNWCSFSPDGKLLATASSDYTARVWEVPSLRLLGVLNGHTDDVDVAKFSPDSRYLATSSHDKTINIYSLETFSLIKRLSGHEGDVLSINWSTDGSRLISTGDDGTVREWNPLLGKELSRTELGGAQTDALAFVADGVFVAGDDDGRLIIIRSGVPEFYDAHKAGVKFVNFNPTLNLLVSLSYDRFCMIWKLSKENELELIKSIRLPYIVWPRSSAFLSSNKLVFGTFGSIYAELDIELEKWTVDDIQPDVSLNAVTVFDKKTHYIGDAGRLYREGELVKDIGTLCNFLLPLGSTLLTGGQTGELFDAYTGEVIYQHRSPLNCGCVIKKGNELVGWIGSYTGDVLIVRSSATGRAQVVDTISIHSNAIKGLVAYGHLVFSCCATGDVALHNADTLEAYVFVERGHTSIANGCAVIPVGFASVGRDLKLRLWNLEGEMEEFSTPHKNSIRSVATSANGRFIATASYRGLIAFFDLHSKSWLNSSRPTTSGISAIVTGKGADDFIASAYDGNTYEVRPETA